MTFVTAEPFPPGEFVADELEARQWSRDHLAAAMGVERRMIDDLIEGRIALDDSLADRIGTAFGTSASLWRNLQVMYDAASRRQKLREAVRVAAEAIRAARDAEDGRTATRRAAAAVFDVIRTEGPTASEISEAEWDESLAAEIDAAQGPR